MKHSVLLVLAILAFVYSAEAQSALQLNCPTIQVSGPAGITDPGDLVHFEVQTSFEVPPSSYRYSWSTKNGKIVRGQGTKTIKVSMPAGPPVTATVTVRGLPSGCPATASEVYSVAIDPGAEKVGETRNLVEGISSGLLKLVVKSLSRNRYVQLYVILYLPDPESVTLKQRVEKTIKAKLSRKQIDPSRMTLTTAPGDKILRFWLVPIGFPNPAP